MKIIFLGTNGWYGTHNSNAICTLIDSEEGYIIFDAGDGIYKLRDYVKEDKPIYLFLSHLHLDHTFGFHIVPSVFRKEKFNVILEKGNEKLLREIIRHPYAVPFGDNFHFNEVLEGEYENPLKFKSLKLSHIDPVMGYRVNLEGKEIAYCLDSGVCDNVVNLAKNTDIFITECSSLPGHSNPEWGHLSPEEAAQMAKDAGAKKMIMTHLSIHYQNEDKKLEAEKIAQKIFKNSLMAEDDLVINL